MCKKYFCHIYCWGGAFSPHVVDYAYFVVDQLQSQNCLQGWLDKHGGRWLLSHPPVSHPVLSNIVKTIELLHVGERMQLALFVETHKSKLLVAHGMSNPRPEHLKVKCL